MQGASPARANTPHGAQATGASRIARIRTQPTCVRHEERKDGNQLALVDDVKTELASIVDEPETVKQAQASTMIRLGGGIRVVQNRLCLEPSFDNLQAAKWLQQAIQTVYRHPALLVTEKKTTPEGVIDVYKVSVTQAGGALALQTGVFDRHTKRLVAGLPGNIVNGPIAQVKAAWRGAFLAVGSLSDPGKASLLDVPCPTRETAMALEGMARRLGVPTKLRRAKDNSIHIVIRDSESVERMLLTMGAMRTSREWSGKRIDGAERGKANRLANFDDANMRRSAKAAVEASKKIERAFEVLGDDIPQNLRDAGQLRIQHKDASLEQLGQLADPPISKDAIAGRIRRLLQLADRTAKKRGISLDDATPKDAAN